MSQTCKYLKFSLTHCKRCILQPYNKGNCFYIGEREKNCERKINWMRGEMRTVKDVIRSWNRHGSSTNRREVRVYVFDEICRLILSSLGDNLWRKKLLSSTWACMIYIFSCCRAIWFIQGIFIWITKLEQHISL